MNNSITNNVLSNLENMISAVVNHSSELSLITRPGKDFSRKSKVGLQNAVNLLMNLKPTTIRYELKNLCNDTGISISKGGFVQVRDKIKYELFETIFNKFNSSYSCSEKYKGYNIVAVDGTELNIPYVSNDELTLRTVRTKISGEVGVPYSQYHLNGMYDCLNSRFIDAAIQGCRETNEIKAMIQMCERYNGPQSIFVADRGYESINLFEHLNKLEKHKYLIRVRDVSFKGSLFSKLELDGEFDEEINLTLTNYQRVEYIKQPKKYKVISNSNQRFDYLDDQNHFYDVKWRVVRFKLESQDNEDVYETIVTNLDSDEFTIDDIKYIYSIRWNIEIAYKYLKTDLNLEYFLSKKRNFIKQEIWIKLIIYNVSTIITNLLEKKRIKKKKRKLEHKINISNAIHCVFDAFINLKRKGGIPPDLDEQIITETSPIRTNRRFNRNHRSRKTASSNYRHY